MATQSFTFPLSHVPFAGDVYDEAQDRKRLTTQIERVLDVMDDGKYRTITELTAELKSRFPAHHFPENSVQAQLRNLRKVGHQVVKRKTGARENGCLYEYAVLNKS